MSWARMGLPTSSTKKWEEIAGDRKVRRTDLPSENERVVVLEESRMALSM